MQSLKKNYPKTILQLWVESIVISLCILVGVVYYYYVRRGSFSLSLLNRAAASEAVILISLSFIISALCYFFDKFDGMIAYRKYLGIVGFYAALVHIFISVVLLQDRYPIFSWLTTHRNTFIPGLIAILLFFLMTLISNSQSAKLLGGQRWRMTLRVAGYTGYFFVLLHIIVFRYNDWLEWLVKRQPQMPPFSLLVLIFMAIIYLCRFGLLLALQKKKKQLRQIRN